MNQKLGVDAKQKRQQEAAVCKLSFGPLDETKIGICLKGGGVVLIICFI